MASPAQALANHANAQHSTGPLTPAGKARSSENATKLGLFCRRDTVPAESRQAYADLTDDLLAQLNPQSRIEEVLVREIISASWRMERCAQIEANSNLEYQPLDSQENNAIERARTSAFRILQRALAELSRVQTNRNTREMVLDIPKGEGNVGLECYVNALQGLKLEHQIQKDQSVTELNHMLTAPLPIRRPAMAATATPAPAAPALSVSANQTQIPRTAPCPCGSGQKYKRCCGIGAPPAMGY